jgi:hypothetical protein
VSWRFRADGDELLGQKFYVALDGNEGVFLTSESEKDAVRIHQHLHAWDSAGHRPRKAWVFRDVAAMLQDTAALLDHLSDCTQSSGEPGSADT